MSAILSLYSHCNTLQRTATHCNTLQHTATHGNILQHTATHCNTLEGCDTLSIPLSNDPCVRARERWRDYAHRALSIEGSLEGSRRPEGCVCECDTLSILIYPHTALYPSTPDILLLPALCVYVCERERERARERERESPLNLEGSTN